MTSTSLANRKSVIKRSDEDGGEVERRVSGLVGTVTYSG